MAKRSDPYSVPFDVPLFSYTEAVRLAADTGMLPGTTGPLLETVVDMLDELGRPDEHFDCIQIAGTNGKTSTTRFTAALLHAEGFRTALYTSPQLVRYEERMEVDGFVVSPDAFRRGVSCAAEAGRRVNARRAAQGLDAYTITPFDLLTVAAMVVFAEARVDVAVLEVGMGGRWDATSATDPRVVAVTGIGLDHMRILGDTLEAIAGEKAAVIKPGRSVILGEGTHEPSVARVMRERCEACDIEPWYSGHELTKRPAHLGDTVGFSCSGPYGSYRYEIAKPVYQAQNAACAVAVAESYLRRALDSAAALSALDACPIPGRFDVVRRDPLVLVDACHNPQSCENFVAALDELDPCVDGRPTLLLAALSDKDVDGIIEHLVPAFPRIVVTETSSDRALPCDELAGMVAAALERSGRPADCFVAAYGSVSEALDECGRRGEALVAAGTITLAGEVAGLLRI